MRILLILLLLISCNPPKSYYISQNIQIHHAMKMLWRDNPESLQILKDVHAKGIHLKFTQGELSGDTLGASRISASGATVTIDITKVTKIHDNLVPVLAHEIFHLQDAYLLGEPETFIDISIAESALPWSERTAEISAVKKEDALRGKLLHLSEYKGMAKSRKDANYMASLYTK